MSKQRLAKGGVVVDMDEVMAQMEADDLADQAELGKMSPREYAKHKGMAPQMVYYYMRTGKIKDELCICGRRVIDVKEADAFLAEKEEQDRRRLGTSFTTE